MNTPKPGRRKAATKKLEPIDWHEFANDAVLHGNMSTLYRRPAAEDPTAYASPEALVEISKRRSPAPPDEPTVGPEPTAGLAPTAKPETPAAAEIAARPTVGPMHPVGSLPTVGLAKIADQAAFDGHRGPDLPTVGAEPPVGTSPTVGSLLTVGTLPKPKIKSIRNVQDALTLAGQVLYRAMYGSADGPHIKTCTKGYRQLAAETHLDKDTVRDLISEFKEKGIARETGTYDPDTRSSKTYEILSNQGVLDLWREAGVQFVTAGRQRPMFCTSTGQPTSFIPTVGRVPRVG